VSGVLTVFRRELAGLFLTQRYAWLYDDAFIYFRYVDNFLYLDFGLVYNKGEFAEGFTSPLWALILIALRPAEVGWWTIVLGIAFLSFIAYWWALVLLNHRIVGKRFESVNLPLCYSVFVYGVGVYFTSGLESPLIQVVAVAYALFIFNPRSVAPLLLVAVSPLIRPELALPLVMAMGWSAWRRRTVPWLLVFTAFVLNGAWLVFRVYYYADFLPVTFYLKDIVDIPQGLAYINNTFGEYYAYPLFGLAAVAFVLLWRRSPRGADWAFPAERAMILLVAGAVLVYVIKIGGNAQHFRYLSFSFCLAVCGLAGIPEWALSRWIDFDRYAAASGAGRYVPAVGSLGLGVVFALWGFLGYPAQLSSHPFFENAESEWVDKIYDSYWHRHHDLFVQNIIEGRDQIDRDPRDRGPLDRAHARGGRLVVLEDLKDRAHPAARILEGEHAVGVPAVGRQGRRRVAHVVRGEGHAARRRAAVFRCPPRPAAPPERNRLLRGSSTANPSPTLHHRRRSSHRAAR